MGGWWCHLTSLIYEALILKVGIDVTLKIVISFMMIIKKSFFSFYFLKNLKKKMKLNRNLNDFVRKKNSNR